ncbi:unnamed protein product, partial [marine sediment metagenome]
AEAILDTESEEHGEVMIGVPLVPPYGMPIFEYILLPKKVYDTMRNAIRAWKIGDIHKAVGVPYDKERFDINRKQLQEGFKISPEYSAFMEKIRKSGAKIIVYKEPAFNFYN